MARSSAPTVQLFPFLAVLVCAMGALILLLLVTTRKMQQVAHARANADFEGRSLQQTSPPEQPAGPELVPSGPSDEELADKASHHAAREARLQANADAQRRQAEREARWQREVAEAEIARDERRHTLESAQAELTDLQQRLQTTETGLQQLLDKQKKLKTLQEHDSERLKQAQREHDKLADAIQESQKRIAELRRAHADSASKFAFVPYDGASGTTRRPIYIECTSSGIRFLPENEVLDESDLKGFTETYNPLLLACERVMQYWRESAAEGTPEDAQRPYILLVVRSNGTVAYYVARKMLKQLADDFGYELVEDEFPLDLPTADPDAKLVIQRAIAEALKNRGEIIAGGQAENSPDRRLGRIVPGRSDGKIEIETLDDQVAATQAAKESPFAKASRQIGKSFSITRSPVSEHELASNSYGSTLAERERKRAEGSPDNLGVIAERVSAPEITAPDSLAQMTRRPDAPLGNGTGSRAEGTGQSATGARIGQPSGSGSDTSTGQRASSGSGTASILPKPSSPGSGRAGTPKTYDLSDPFARDQLATGRHGLDTAETDSNRGEEVAGNDLESTGSGGSKSNLKLRDAPGAPQGARAGKVIDISPSGSSQAVAASTGSRTGSSTRPRGPSGTNGDAGSANPNQSSPQTASPGSTVELGTSRPQFARSSSTDPSSSSRGVPATSNTRQQRVYGDNPEARQELAKLKSKSKAASVAEKRDSSRQRWGGTNTGQIGFERKVDVQIMADKIVIGKNDVEIVVEPGTSQEELVEAVLEGLDEHSQTWGKPPSRFYWVPFVNFDVYNGGNNHYQRLNSELRDWGVFSEAKFKQGEKPPEVKTAKTSDIQPVSQTDAKLVRPNQSASSSTDPKGKATVKTPEPDSQPKPGWFKRITNGTLGF